MNICEIDGCDKKTVGRHLCRKHYIQWYRKFRIQNSDNIKKCSVDNCNGILDSKGYCGRHYQQFLKYGAIIKRTKYDPNEFIIDGNICRIKLYNEQCEEITETIIDSEDYDTVKNYKWGLWKEKDGSYYAITTIDNKRLSLAHCVLGHKSTMAVHIDHADRNKLDNRKENLRVATNSQNGHNSKLYKNNKSGYKGVHWNSFHEKWAASIRVNKKFIHLGYFTDKLEAANTYILAAKKYYGEFAFMNKDSKNKEETDESKDQKLTEDDILEIKTIDIFGFTSFLKGKKLLERPDIYA